MKIKKIRLCQHKSLIKKEKVKTCLYISAYGFNEVYWVERSFEKPAAGPDGLNKGVMTPTLSPDWLAKQLQVS